MNEIVLTESELNTMLTGRMTDEQRNLINKVKSMQITHHDDGSDEVEFCDRHECREHLELNLS